MLASDHWSLLSKSLAQSSMASRLSRVDPIQPSLACEEAVHQQRKILLAEPNERLRAKTTLPVAARRETRARNRTEVRAAYIEHTE